jgi:putative addiction module component (TIGR02574 family)
MRCLDGPLALAYLRLMTPKTLSDLLALTEAERIQLVQDLWDSIPEESAALPLSSDQRRELDRRWEEHQRDPASAIPWEEARSQLRTRFGA